MEKQKIARAFTPDKGGAFTLIELLVVIAIIAILAGILFLYLPRREDERVSPHVSQTTSRWARLC